MTDLITGISWPEVTEVEGGEEPRWTSVSHLDAVVDEEAQNRTKEVIEGANFLHIFVDEGHTLVFGVRGFMDSAVAETASTLKLVIGPILTAKLTQVVLINNEDGIRQIDDNRKPRRYDITKTILNLLGDRDETTN